LIVCATSFYKQGTGTSHANDPSGSTKTIKLLSN